MKFVSTPRKLRAARGRGRGAVGGEARGCERGRGGQSLGGSLPRMDAGHYLDEVSSALVIRSFADKKPRS